MQITSELISRAEQTSILYTKAKTPKYQSDTESQRIFSLLDPYDEGGLYFRKSETRNFERIFFTKLDDLKNADFEYTSYAAMQDDMLTYVVDEFATANKMLMSQKYAEGCAKFLCILLAVADGKEPDDVIG